MSQTPLSGAEPSAPKLRDPYFLLPCGHPLFWLDRAVDNVLAHDALLQEALTREFSQVNHLARCALSAAADHCWENFVTYADAGLEELGLLACAGALS